MSCGIGALIITHQEEDNIEGCLESLAFCDERVVVDSFSDDRTVERALAHADQVVKRSFTTHAEQKNWGMGLLSSPWVLILDADERVPPELADELCELAKNGDRAGYWLRRENFFFGRAIRGAGWGRDRVLRFFRRNAGVYPERAVHEEVELHDDAEPGVCRARLAHYSYTDWDRTFARLLDYSTKGAALRAGRGKRASAFSVLTAPPRRFFTQYVLRGGFRDGLHGLVLCLWSSTGIFLREAKLAVGETGIAARGLGQGGETRVEVVRGPGKG